MKGEEKTRGGLDPRDQAEPALAHPRERACRVPRRVATDLFNPFQTPRFTSVVLLRKSFACNEHRFISYESKSCSLKEFRFDSDRRYSFPDDYFLAEFGATTLEIHRANVRASSSCRTGLPKKSSIPDDRHFSRSSPEVLAVRAIRVCRRFPS